jgi:hypothetical protein
MNKVNLLLDNLMAIGASENAIDIKLIAIASTIVFVWIGLAALAASYVELRGGKNGIAFTLGIFLPVIGPILSILTTNGQKHPEQFITGDLVHSYTPPKTAEEKSDHTPESISAEDAFDIRFFQEKTKALGANQTYQLSMGERVISVNKILECLPNVLLVEMIDEDGNAQRMRIPYVKIQGVRY